ncbi:tetratricopeptide repeat protein [Marinobacterium lutimaris]|uniref:Response regulator receiver domain-containing protein n=1 Tax=Marinobacterium lutimaris TaxID=568106 RepID=A0A1H6AW25_9GAMM|nr:tetratricopeptide repeat protein [Marinobacterium lutimaris]SEG52267.1 Response regulator receiver domain-containing protein [Marinobacterium lutimaris]
MANLFSGKSTLILDKKFEDLQTLRTILGQIGVSDIQVASSVNMALSLLREQAVDILFLNYELGRNEKNGLQLMFDLQAEGRRLFAAAYILVIEPEKSELLLGSPENAPDIYISKPYDRVQLSQRIEKLMRLKETLRPIESLLDRGEWEAALAACDRHAERYPGLSVYLQRLRGIIYLQQGQAEEARKVFSSLLASRDKPWIRIGLAMAACRSGWFLQARGQLDHVISQQQVCIEAFVWRARVYRLFGDLGEAASLLRRAVVLQPTVALLRGDLANLAAMNNDTALAVDAFRAAIQYSRYSAFQHPDYYFGLVRMLMKRMSGPASAEAEEAVRLLEQARRDFLDQPVIHFKSRLLASEIYRNAGDDEQANLSAGEAMSIYRRLSPDEQAMWLEQLVEGVEGSSVEVEAQEARQALNRNMAKLQWGRANLKGMMQFRHGELDEAYVSFSDALRRQPGTPSIALNLVQTALELCRRKGDEIPRALLVACDEALYALQFAALTPKQQQRYLGLGRRLSDFVRRLDGE